MKANSGIGDWISAAYEQGIPFLQQIPREAADFILLNASIQEYDAGDVIITGGDSNIESFAFYKVAVLRFVVVFFLMGTITF